MRRRTATRSVFHDARAVLNMHEPPNTLRYPTTLPGGLLHDLGFDVHVVSRGEAKRRTEVEGVPLWIEPDSRAVMRRLASLRPEILFVEATSYGSLLRPFARRMWIRNPAASSRPGVVWAQRAAVRLADAVTFTNPHDRHAWPVRPEQIADLAYPVELDRWTERVERDDSWWTGRGLEVPRGPVVACVAGLLRRKRQIEALDALVPMLHEDPTMVFVLVGHGFEPDVVTALEARRRAEGLEARVVLTGPLGHEQVRGLYAWASATITNSTWESQCMSVYESLASGVPALISDIPQLTSQFPHLPSHHDGAELARNLRRVLDDPAYAKDVVDASMPQVRWADRARHDRVFVETIERLRDGRGLP